MKSFGILFCAIAVCSASVINDPGLGYKEGDRYFYFPGDGDGVLHLVDAWEPVDEAFLAGITKNPADNAYWLYTRKNPDIPEILIDGEESLLRQSKFNPKKTTVFLAHGWNGHGNNDMNRLLTDAFLIDGDVNVIVVDWSRLANRGYTTAKSGVAAVGRGVGEFVNWLTKHGLSYDNVHLVGFSLGGHLVGNAGRAANGRIKRITALDPAGPLWGSDSNKLHINDGQYVEVIHTNTGLYGYHEPLGDADYYPNGGSGMPGCWLSSCSHGRSYEYMASTVKHNHLLANECNTLRDADRGRCNGDLYPMGNSALNKTKSGIFRVDTARNYPY